MTRSWTDRDIQYLKENYPAGDVRMIADHLGRTVSAVKSKVKVLGLKKLRKRTEWTPEMLKTLKDKYPDVQTETIAKELELSLTAVYQKANSLGLYKSAEFYESGLSGRLSKNNCNRGKGTRFKKGHIPFNKGKKMKIAGRMSETFFKPGHRPQNAVPVGTEVVSSDGYLKVKVAEPNEWKYKHRLVWENENGSIAKGMALIFKDGNRMNCSIENLELLTRSELMRRNTIHRYPRELRDAIRSVGKLRKEIRNAEEQNHGS